MGPGGANGKRPGRPTHVRQWPDASVPRTVGWRGVRGGRAVVVMRTVQVSSGDWHRGPNLVPYVEHITLQRMEHVGIVVDDLAAATKFLVELGLALHADGPVEGRWVDRVLGLEGVR